jgi:hypothetical protein
MDTSGFRGLLLAVENCDRLPDAFQVVYKKSMEDLWNDFLNKNK